MRPNAHHVATALVLGAMVLAPVPNAVAVAAVDHDLPLQCGQTWTASTRAGHSPSVRSVDFNRVPDEGEPVLASAPGTVTAAYADPNGGYGRWVVIDHGDSASTLYAHLGKVTVAVGQRVDRGAMLGAVGNSGNSRGAHLHYEQRTGSTVVRAWFDGSRLEYGPVTSRNCVDVPVAGDFLGDAAAEVGVYRRARRSKFRIQAAGSTPTVIRFGRAFESPLVGDWDGNGQTDVGVHNPLRATFRLRIAGTSTPVRFGGSADQPVVGDWDGDGRTDVGVRRPSDATFRLRLADGSSSPVWLGDSDDIAITGDWDGDGRTDLGVFDQATATFTLRTVLADGRSAVDVRQLGQPGDLPVSGDWDGDGSSDVGVWTPASATFTLQVTARQGTARPASRTVRFGRAR